MAPGGLTLLGRAACRFAFALDKHFPGCVTIERAARLHDQVIDGLFVCGCTVVAMKLALDFRDGCYDLFLGDFGLAGGGFKAELFD